MITNQAITEKPTTKPHVFCFEISGQVKSKDLEEMAQRLNQSFDLYDTVNLLLIFKNFEGSDFGAGFTGETMKAQFRSLANVKKYIAVGAPDAAQTMIETFGALLPVDAHTFELQEIEAAWSEVDARPAS